MISRLTGRRNNRRRRSTGSRLGAVGAALRAYVKAVGALGSESGAAASSELVRAPRLMFARVGTGVLAFTCLVLLVVVVMSFDQYSARTRRFVVSEFVVEGQRHMSEAELVAASGVELGASLLKVAASGSAVRGRLEALPWVSRAEVHTVMPSRVVLRVWEHVPVAMVADSDLLLVDRDGRLFKKVETGIAHDLPIITGISTQFLRPGTQVSVVDVSEAIVQRGLLRTALGILESVAASPLATRVPLSEIHLDSVQGVTLVSAVDGAEWRLGHRELSELPVVLRRMTRLYDYVYERGQRLRYVLMDDPRRPERAVMRAVDESAPMLLAHEGRSRKVGGAANARLPRVHAEHRGVHAGHRGVHAERRSAHAERLEGSSRGSSRGPRARAAGTDSKAPAETEQEMPVTEEPLLGP